MRLLKIGSWVKIKKDAYATDIKTHEVVPIPEGTIAKIDSQAMATGNKGKVYWVGGEGWILFAPRRDFVPIRK